MGKVCVYTEACKLCRIRRISAKNFHSYIELQAFFGIFLSFSAFIAKVFSPSSPSPFAATAVDAVLTAKRSRRHRRHLPLLSNQNVWRCKKCWCFIRWGSQNSTTWRTTTHSATYRLEGKNYSSGHNLFVQLWKAKGRSAIYQELRQS